MHPPLQPRLAAYADLILAVGLNLQPGQRLLIAGSTLNGVDINLAPFVRLLTEKAYATGAFFVDVLWWYPEIDLIRLRTANRDSLATFPRWFAAALLEYFQSADAFLIIYADDPDLFATIPAEDVSAFLTAIRTTVAEARGLLLRNAFNWCVASAPTPGWSAKVAPALTPTERDAYLWDLILSVCRLDEPNPTAAWRSHVAQLSARADYLTAKQYSTLKYSAPGIDLVVGLPPGHVWHGGAVQAENGVRFVPNLPTEEVFTLPHRLQADGHITSTRPFQSGGATIDAMELVFRNGRVVRHSAKTGDSTLSELLRTDEGATRLGEVALVPHSSPISRANVVFHNALFDENAASHLALGTAYRFCLRGAEALTADEFSLAGGNQSLLHCDFMIGSNELDVDGITLDEQTEPLMRAGEWAFHP